MAAPNSVIADALMAVSGRRVRSDREMVDEFESGTGWLAATISSCKRKILESAGLAAEGSVSPRQGNAKKAKTVEEPPTSAEFNAYKENSHPNVPAPSAASGSEPAMKSNTGKTKELVSEDDSEVPHHPDDDIDVMGMKVAELRAELRSRGLETNGLKKDLQKSAAIEEAREDRRKAATVASSAAIMGRAETGEEEEKENECLAMQKLKKNEEQARREEEMRRHAVKSMDQEDHMATEATAVMDFPGVNVDSLKIAGENSSTQGIETSLTDLESGQSKEGAEEAEPMEGMDPIDESPEIKAVGMAEMTNGGNAEDSSSSSEYEDLREDSPDSKDDNDVQMEDNAAAGTASEGNADTEMMSPSKYPKKTNIGKKIMKATTKLFSPAKKKGVSPVKPTKQESEEDSDAMPPPPPMPSALKQRPIGSSTQNAGNAESVKKVKLPGPSSSSSSSSLLKTPAVGHKPVFSKSTEARRKAAEEARKKRLAEMRGKSKPVELTQSQKAKLATADPSALRKAVSKNTLKSSTMEISHASQSAGSVASSSSSSVASASSKSSAQDKQKAEKRKIMTAQIREKAAAAHAQKKGGVQKAKPEIKSAAPVVQKVAAMKQRILEQKKISQQSKHAAQPVAPKSPAKATQRQQPEVLSPMDTYEMSDRGSDSESEYSDSEEEQSPKKKIPKWAQRSNLIPALEKQYMDGPGRIDPDNIFPEVSTCDLTMVFDKKKSRYQKRTSSGNWTKDRVTAQEKLVYKRTMGYAK
eukprot:CAMPEP_0113590312 /NCGR_PEP_ID=MMETSP0015_2-20120614/36601_1 /TAXON_ID=2838 /ORGANISM="Odontella" /LENGTH=753 /DNA_ID=CAMNT_0000496483 /DNA_START=49 /DNA_END=2309 /DNA_ORIENTATION=- /assembly_acc=CAM_ASM_000160